MSVKGSTTSEEVKAKISASQKARWERIRAKMAKGDLYEERMGHLFHNDRYQYQVETNSDIAGIEQIQSYQTRFYNCIGVEHKPTRWQRIKSLFA